MKINKIFKLVAIATILKGIFVISVILSFLLWSLPILTFNTSLWLLFQKRSDVTLELDEVKDYNNQVADFFIRGFRLNFLTEKEFSHMQDVRQWVIIGNILFAFSFIGLIVEFAYFSRKQKQFLINALRKTSLVTFAVTLVISLMILLNFQTAFLQFHKIFFVRNFIFPAESVLTRLYPDSFFLGLSALYLISILLVSGITFLISGRLKLKLSNREDHKA